MASLTKVTKHRRRIRRAKAGRRAKAHRRIHGTTPPFPIHTPEADALAAAKARAKAEQPEEA